MRRPIVPDADKKALSRNGTTTASVHIASFQAVAATTVVKSTTAATADTINNAKLRRRCPHDRRAVLRDHEPPER
jgi:hypothetical protein